MKIKRIFLFVLILTSFGVVGCIDENETDEVILERDIKAIASYLEDNKIVNVKEFEDPGNGIRVIWQEISNSGVKVTNGDTLTVDYTGKLLSNKVFDTSIESVARTAGIFSNARNYIPLKFPLGRRFLIPGFEFGVAQMEVGDKATVLMPSIFGYGSTASGDIPSNAPLIFELVLLDAKAGPKN